MVTNLWWQLGLLISKTTTPWAVAWFVMCPPEAESEGTEPYWYFSNLLAVPYDGTEVRSRMGTVVFSKHEVELTAQFRNDVSNVEYEAWLEWWGRIPEGPQRATLISLLVAGST